MRAQVIITGAAPPWDRGGITELVWFFPRPGHDTDSDAGSTYTGETKSIGSAAAGSARTESTETARFGSAPAFAFTVTSFVGFAPACSDASSYPVTFADARSDAQ